MGNSLSVVHGLSAAKKFTSKAVFCVDNLDPSVGVNELCDFARKLSVNVLSCFRAQPQRQRNESGPVLSIVLHLDYALTQRIVINCWTEASGQTQLLYLNGTVLH